MLVFVLLTTLLAACTLLPKWQFEHWIIRSLDFPRLQFATALAVLVLAELILLKLNHPGTWILVAIGIGCIILQLRWILPYSPLVKQETHRVRHPDPSNSIRILTANVLTPNREAHKLIALIERHQPDIVVTLESDHWWQQQLDTLSDQYPHALKCPLDNLYGMHVYSRLPLSDTTIDYLVEDDVPSMHALVELPSGQKVRCHFLHPAPPSPTENEASTERDAELIVVAKTIADCHDAVIVTGDLNDVAWSKTTQLFRKISGLLDPRIGRGMYNTFHAKHPYLRWPLDHLFHSHHFALSQIQRMDEIGSDHFPLLSELTYIGQEGQQQSSIEPDQEDRKLAQEKTKQEDVSPEDVPEPGH